MIVEDWTSTRLKNVAEINTRSLPSTTLPDFAFRYLDISNVDREGIVSEESIRDIEFGDAPSRARRCVTNGDVLVSSVRPNLQAIAHITDANHLVTSTGFFVVSVRKNKLVPRFCYYLMLSEGAKQYFDARAIGVGYPAVGDKDFTTIHFRLPPAEEQRRITSYLDHACTAIDGTIKAKQKQLESLAELRESIIHKAVTRGLDDSVELKDSGVEWLGKIPSHWAVERVKRILSRLDYGTSQSSNHDGQFPVLKMGHIEEGELVYSKLDYVDDIPDDLLLERDDLLYNRTNSPDRVGKAAIFRGSKADGITFASYLVRLRVNHRADAHYLNYMINSKCFLDFIRHLAIPSVQQSNLNSTRYTLVPIPVPPLSEQKCIAEHLDKVSRRFLELQQNIAGQIDTLYDYRKSLIHECVTGKRRISEADIRKVSAHD